MKKIVDLEITHEWLGTDSAEESKEEKKAAAAERKRLRELRERHPIEIEVSFKLPWWVLT
jgi:hypothetical protein